MKAIGHRYLFLTVIVLVAFSTLFLYLIELLTSKPVFDVFRFSVNYVISLPFILLMILADYGLVVWMNRVRRINRNIYVRVALEGLAAVLLSAVLVVIGNLPFVDDLREYICSLNYWKSVMAAVLINIFTLTSIEFFVQNRINQELQNENEVMRYRQLKSQINPHFLFNSLNVLVSLINRDGDLAVDYTKKLSEVYRYVLTRDQADTVPVADELEFIGNYIGILRTRFREGLEFQFCVREEDRHRSLPPMSLQLLVENAVKHNAVSAMSPLIIRIASDGAFLSVSNNINLRISEGPGTGTGLGNLAKKYSIIAGKSIVVEKTETFFSVRLPLL